MKSMRIRTLGLSLVAVFALGAIASATASAAKPELVNSKKEPLAAGTKLTSTSGVGTFETKSGEKVTCEKDTNTGEITGPKADTAKITFTGCTAKVSIITAKCKSKGEATGTIKLSVNSKLVYISESAKTVGLDLVLPENLTIECEAFGSKETLTVKGSTICPLSPLDKLSVKLTLSCKQTKGAQEPSAYEEGGKAIEDFTETEGKGLKNFAFEKSGLTSTDELEFGGKEVEVEA